MLTKERFIEIISELQEEDEIVDKLEVALTEYYRESGYVFRCNTYMAAIIKLLEFVLNDDIDLIDW